jgi:hypothetical protein
MVIREARTYIRDDVLLMRLRQWRGVIRSAAYSRELHHRRYRDLASALRSIDEQLGRYIQRMEDLKEGPRASGPWRLATCQPANGGISGR